jgi:siroheme synthase
MISSVISRHLSVVRSKNGHPLLMTRLINIDEAEAERIFSVTLAPSVVSAEATRWLDRLGR